MMRKKEIVKLLDSLHTAIEKGKLESALSEQERQQVISTISQTVESQLNSSLLEMIESKYGNTVYRDKLASKAERLLNSTISRLEAYNEDLKKESFGESYIWYCFYHWSNHAFSLFANEYSSTRDEFSN
ncbi:hypothetical protein [Aeromonas veronii]|uniref:hypothetical protein n=1 Tax=Aeromonas veronii TaxID=654 RepID=UPI003DA2FAAC